jgi:hypothetical protein
MNCDHIEFYMPTLRDLLFIQYTFRAGDYLLLLKLYVWKIKKKINGIFLNIYHHIQFQEPTLQKFACTQSRNSQNQLLFIFF